MNNPKAKDNLKLYSDKTPEEKYEFHRKGAEKVNEIRRKRKKIREDLELALAAMSEDGEYTYQEKGIIALMIKLQQGDVQAWTFVRDTIGEKPVDKVEANVKNTKLDNLEKQLFGDGDKNEDDK